MCLSPTLWEVPWALPGAVAGSWRPPGFQPRTQMLRCASYLSLNHSCWQEGTPGLAGEPCLQLHPALRSGNHSPGLVVYLEHGWVSLSALTVGRLQLFFKRHLHFGGVENTKWLPKKQDLAYWKKLLLPTHSTPDPVNPSLAPNGHVATTTSQSNQLKVLHAMQQGAGYHTTSGVC